MVTTMRRVFWIALLGILVTPAVARAQGEEVVYYHTDAIGSVRMITDPSGTVLARYDYTPFGQPWNPPGTVEAMQFAGKERELQDGNLQDVLDHFLARDVLSFTGRFTTVDPGHVNGDVFDPQSWNSYAYARNNSFVYTDPSGTEYQICAFGGRDFPGSCGWISNPSFFDLINNPGPGIRLSGGWIYAGNVKVGSYRTAGFGDWAQLTGALSSGWLREQATSMAIGATIAATGGLTAGAFSGGLAIESSLSIARGVSSNTLNHIFGKAAHNLSSLVARFGSREAAFSAVRSATQAAVRAKGITGIFETTVRVGGQSVVVRGNVINGIARIGTFFVP